MGFDSLAGYLPKAFDKINQGELARAGLTCTRVNKFIRKNYPDMHWHATKFIKGDLTIAVTSATHASLLYLEANKLKFRLNKLTLSEAVIDLHIKVGE